MCVCCERSIYIFKCLLTRALDSAERVFYDDTRKKRKKQTPRPGLAQKKNTNLLFRAFALLFHQSSSAALTHELACIFFYYTRYINTSSPPAVAAMQICVCAVKQQKGRAALIIGWHMRDNYLAGISVALKRKRRGVLFARAFRRGKYLRETHIHQCAYYLRERELKNAACSCQCRSLIRLSRKETMLAQNLSSN